MVPAPRKKLASGLFSGGGSHWQQRGKRGAAIRLSQVEVSGGQTSPGWLKDRALLGLLGILESKRHFWTRHPGSHGHLVGSCPEAWIIGFHFSARRKVGIRLSQAGAH